MGSIIHCDAYERIKIWHLSERRKSIGSTCHRQIDMNPIYMTFGFG